MSEFKTIYTISGQTLIDIAIQEYGQYEGVFKLAEDNEVVTSVEQILTPGTMLRIRIGEGNISSDDFELNEVTMNSGFTPPPVESEEYFDDGFYDEGYI